MNNLRQLQSKISNPDFQLPGKSFLLRGGISGQRFKVRHLLFEVCDMIIERTFSLIDSFWLQPLRSDEINSGSEGSSGSGEEADDDGKTSDNPGNVHCNGRLENGC